MLPMSSTPTSGVSYPGFSSFLSLRTYCKSINFELDERLLTLIEQFIKPACEERILKELIEIIELISLKIDVKSASGQNIAMLHLLAMQKDIDYASISAFLDSLEPQARRETVNYQWEEGDTFLHRAIFKKTLLQILIKAGAENLSDKHGCTPLHRIYRLPSHQKEICEILLFGLDPQTQNELVNRRNKNNQTVLDSALTISDPECIRLLLNAGAEIFPDQRGFELFRKALFFNASKEVLELLLFSLEPEKQKELVNYNEQGITIFHLAIWSKASIEVIELLLAAGVTIEEMPFYIKANILHWACYSLQVFTLLYQKMVSGLSAKEKLKVVNCRFKNQQTILHLAVIHGFGQTILSRLISDGASHLQDQGGKTPFHYMVFDEKFPENFLAMLSGGSNATILNIEDNEGQTVLTNAANAIASASIIKGLIKYGATGDLNKCKADKGLTKLHYAVLIGAPLEIFLKIFKDQSDIKEFVNRQDQEGFTALHYAVNRRLCLSVIKLLLSAGASVEIQSNIGFTSLHSAARGDAPPEYFELLLGSVKPADRTRVVNIKNKQGINAFCCAALNKTPSYLIFKTLIAYGSTTDGLKSLGFTSLCIAAILQAPKGKYIKILGWRDQQKRKDFLNKQDILGHTFLHKAVIYHIDPKIIVMLVVYGAVCIKDKQGWTPLYYIDMQKAEESDYFGALLHNLQNRKEIVNSQDINGQTVLHKAVISGAALEVIATLMKYGAENIQDKEGKTPLHYVKNPQTASKLYAILLEGQEKKELLNLQDEHGHTVLHKAVIYKIRPNTIATLVGYGAENMQDKQGKTPLFFVCSDKTEAPELYTALLSGLDHRGKQTILDWQISPQNTTTVLVMVIKNKKTHPSIIRLLVRWGADVKESLHCAILQESPIEIYQALLDELTTTQRNAALNTKNSQGYMALHVLIHSFNHEIFQLFMTYGMQVNVQDKEGDTPLHIANQYHYYPVIECLLANGADPTIVNQKNEKALANPEKILSQGKNVMQRWRRFSSNCDEEGRVVDCSYENIDKTGTALILQAARDHNKALSMYPTKIDYSFDRLVATTDNYKSTLLKVVDSPKNAINAIGGVESKISRLAVECHGPGSDLDLYPGLLLGENEDTRLFIGNKEWIETLCNKLENDAVVIFYSCGLGREEKEGRINLCQEVACNVKGSTVIASDKSFRGVNSVYVSGQLLDMRFFAEDGQEELTVVFQEDSRVRHFRYLEKEVREDYFLLKV